MEFYRVVSSSQSSGEPSGDVITADEFNQAAIASGRTMVELAAMIGVSRSMVHGYRNHGVTRPRTVEQVRRVMGMWLRDNEDNPYDGYSDDDLLREMGRRLQRLHELLSQTSPDAAQDPDSIHDTAAGDGSGRYTGTGGPA